MEGETRYIDWNHSLIKDEFDQILGTLSSGQDVTCHKRAEQEIFRIAMTNHLTGLLNRRSFYQHLLEALSLAQRNNLTVSMIAMDLDQFKPVNDQFGHEIGDKVLVKTAEILREILRDSDHIFRLGGDEFSIIAVGKQRSNALDLSLERLLKALNEPMIFDEKKI